MTKGPWTDLSEGQIAKRLGRALELEFAHGAPVGIGGEAFGLTLVGEESYVALEVETKHTHPAENVLQYWPWMERNRRRLVLIHAIAPDARKRTGHRADLTRWLGAMMERVIPGRFTYCRLDLGSPDEEAQLATAKAAIVELATTRERRIAPGL
ncbi:MAG TPA: hypothetical protein VFY23_02470 [Candidatus Limnocylindrales bacterium]|nr:hypothetical protein [Candidatus Limnocylindrales bacterium]